MTAPMQTARLWADGSTVDVNGVVYYQIPIIAFKHPAPGGNPCRNCVATDNMRLCDTICMHCKLNHVFQRRRP